MALDWLKPILGDTYSDELDGKISAEIGKHFVSREDFNTKTAPVRRQGQLILFSFHLIIDRIKLLNRIFKKIVMLDIRYQQNKKQN